MRKAIPECAQLFQTAGLVEVAARVRFLAGYSRFFSKSFSLFRQALIEWGRLFETASLLLHGADPYLRKAGARLAISSPINATGPGGDRNTIHGCVVSSVIRPIHFYSLLCLQKRPLCDAVVGARANSQYRAGIGDYQSKPEAALPLYSHCRVSSSVHPGTANRGVGVPPLIEGLGLEALIADKAFDSNAIIADLDARGAKVVISQHPRRAKPLAIDDGDVQMAASNRELLRQTEGIQTYRHTRRQDR